MGYITFVFVKQMILTLVRFHDTVPQTTVSCLQNQYVHNPLQNRRTQFTSVFSTGKLVSSVGSSFLAPLSLDWVSSMVSSVLDFLSPSSTGSSSSNFLYKMKKGFRTLTSSLIVHLHEDIHHYLNTSLQMLMLVTRTILQRPSP